MAQTGFSSCWVEVLCRRYEVCRRGGYQYGNSNHNHIPLPLQVSYPVQYKTGSTSSTSSHARALYSGTSTLQYRPVSTSIDQHRPVPTSTSNLHCQVSGIPSWFRFQIMISPSSLLVVVVVGILSVPVCFTTTGHVSFSTPPCSPSDRCAIQPYRS